jgi:PAS domain S-box-containing protein
MIALSKLAMTDSAPEPLSAARQKAAAILVSTTRYAGSALFRALARRLAEELSLPACAIAELVEGDPAKLRLKTHALWADGKFVEDFDYALAGSIGEPALRERRSWHTTAVAREFPHDDLLATLDASEFLAIPLFSIRGKGIGLLVAGLDAKASAPSSLSLYSLQSLLERVGTRAAVELEQIKAECRLEFDERWLRSVIESNSEVTAVLNPNGELQFASRAWETATGHRPDELVGLSLLRFVHPDDHTITNGLLTELFFQHRPSSSLVCRLQHRTGQWLDFELHGHVLVDSPLRNQVVIRGRPLAHRAGANQPPAHRQRLECLGSAVGLVAHDFRNLLTPILTYARTARMALPEEHPIQANLDAIIKSALQADQLTNQILLFAHPEPILRSAYPAICLPHIVTDALPLLRVSIPKQIELRTRFSSENGLVNADTAQIHQLLLNLCVNAAQALEGKAGGWIEVATRHATVDAEMARQNPGLNCGRHIVLSVEDNGQGMDDNTQRRAFDPFFTTKAPGHGTGLGLAAVRDIVQRHSGIILVRSRPEQGTTFEIFFPAIEMSGALTSTSTSMATATSSTETVPTATAATTAPIPSGPSLESGLRGLRILLVDDEEPLLFLLKRALTQCGAEVTARTCAKAALEYLRENRVPFDAVVTDLNMPEFNGHDFAREIRQLDALIRIVVMTGYCRSSVARAIEAIGNTVVIDKSVDAAEFGNTVSAALRDTGSAGSTD